jgi:hypothetical protein
MYTENLISIFSICYRLLKDSLGISEYIPSDIMVMNEHWIGKYVWEKVGRDLAEVLFQRMPRRT